MRFWRKRRRNWRGGNRNEGYIDEHQAKLEDMKVANQPTTKEEAQPQKVDEQANQQSQQVDQHENDQQN